MKKYLYVMMTFALVTLVCFSLTACGGDGEIDQVPIDDPESQPITNNVDAEQYIDASHSPALSEIQKSWVGEYEGYDSNQKKNTKIKRLLILQPNNSYVNIVQGVLIESGKSEYVDFEREQGTYSYNERTKTITYTVKSDSILDYGTQKFDGYKGKKYYDHTDGNYTEKVSFSYLKDNQRSWITRDTYLQSLTDRTINIAFAMVQQADKEERK